MYFLKLVICSFLIIAVSANAQLVKSPENVEAFKQAQNCYKAALESDQRVEIAECAEKVLQSGQLIFMSDSKNIAALTYNYGLSLVDLDKQKSLKTLKTAVGLYEEIYGKDSPELVDVLFDARQFQRALRVVESTEGKTSVMYAQIALDASILLVSDRATTKSELNQSSRFAREAYDIFNKEFGSKALGTTLASFQLGKNKMVLGQYKSSIPFFEIALNNPSVGQYAHGFLIPVYEKLGQSDLATFHAQELGKLLPDREGQDYIPVIVKNPKYPKKAQRKGKEGYVIIELTISKEGLALDPVVIEEKPKGQKFGKAALKAASSLRYVPRFVDGEPEEVPGVLYKYTFKMAR